MNRRPFTQELFSSACLKGFCLSVYLPPTAGLSVKGFVELPLVLFTLLKDYNWTVLCAAKSFSFICRTLQRQTHRADITSLHRATRPWTHLLAFWGVSNVKSRSDCTEVHEKKFSKPSMRSEEVMARIESASLENSCISFTFQDQ